MMMGLRPQWSGLMRFVLVISGHGELLARTLMRGV
jgi:hypothetical protein